MRVTRRLIRPTLDDRRRPEQIQHEYYTANSDAYDAAMVAEGDPHFVALDLISALIDGYGYRSVLDVGSGTGRGVKHFLERHEGVTVRGVEPVRAMIDRAEGVNGVPRGCIVEASGDALPFADGEFDVVCELGVLHHVAKPERILAEMTRVARRGVFLSDENRFADARLWRGVAKFVLHRTRLWSAAYWLAQGGRSYHLTDDDGGVAYSYSVYDSLPALQAWADRTFMVPTAPARITAFHPLFAAPNLLLAGLRDG